MPMVKNQKGEFLFHLCLGTVLCFAPAWRYWCFLGERKVPEVSPERVAALEAQLRILEWKLDAKTVRKGKECGRGRWK